MLIPLCFLLRVALFALRCIFKYYTYSHMPYFKIIVILVLEKAFYIEFKEALNIAFASHEDKKTKYIS